MVMLADKWLKCGKLLFQKGNYVDAEKFFLSSIQQGSKNAATYVYLGEIYRHQGRLDDYVKCYKNALVLTSDDPEANQLIAAFNDFSAASNSKTSINQRTNTNIGCITKKLLAVYDLSAQPYSVGDILNFLAGTLIKLSELSLATIDFCFVCDASRTPIDQVFSKMMLDNNRLHNLFTLMPLLQLNDRIGSIYVFDSYKEFKNFVAFDEQYEVWPRMEQLEQNDYSYYEIIHLLEKNYSDLKKLPQLTLPNALHVWCYEFLKANVGKSLPVTINIRNNKLFHAERNALVPEWVAFFNYCNGRYPAKFIVICSLSEIPDEFIACKNVVIAKHHNSLLENDMALMMVSAFHLGSPSGPTMIPILSDKPYSIFGCGSMINILPTLIQESATIARFSFASRNQKLVLVPENLSLLIHEFESIWNSRDWSDWAFSTNEDEHLSQLSWLK